MRSVPGTRWTGGLLLLLLLLPMVLLGAFTYITTYKSSTDFIFREREATAYLAANLVQERLDKIATIAITTAARPLLIEAAEQKNWAAAVGLVEYIPKYFPYIETVFLADEKGVIREGVPGFRDMIGKDFAFRDWYKGVSKDWKPYVSEVYKRANEPCYNVTAIAVPIKGVSSKGQLGQNILGILVLQVKLEVFADWARDVYPGSEGFIYIVDQGGHLVWHPKFDPQGDIVDFNSVPSVKKLRQGKDGCELNYNPIVKEEVLVAYKPVGRYGWGVDVVQPARQAFARRDQSLGLLLAMCGIVLAMALALSIAFIRAASILRQTEIKTGILNENLRRSNQELEQFAYVASHDLQEPLRTMTSFVELLQRRYKGKLDAEADEFIGYVTQSASRMQMLISDLLELSRVNTKGGKFVQTDSASALGRALVNLRSAIDSSGAVVTSNDMPQLTADSSQLIQLFQNLIDNGIKFRRGDIPHINISARRDDGSWLFAVRDNGIGIEPQYVDKIFQVFQKLHGHDKYPGSGIGLAICKKIVERHGGLIWAESKFGVGSTFYFTIPLKEGGTDA